MVSTFLPFITHNFLPLLVGILGVGFVIAFHEFGHFMFGKLFGINIPSFSIGFGPKLISKKMYGTTFSLSLIPLGGYVEAETGDFAKPRRGTIAALAYWQKMLIVVGGIACNFLFAYFVFVGLSMTGIPGNPFFSHGGNHTIQKVENGSAAAHAGLHPGDKIVAVNDTETHNDLGKLLDVIRASAGQQVILKIEHDGHTHTKHATIGTKTVQGKDIGTLGVQFGFESTPPVGLIEAFAQGYTITASILKATAQGFARLFAQRSTDGLAGPLMMISMSIHSAGQGIGIFLVFLAFISISLGVLNLIPLPILDGGQAVTYTIETLLQRPIKERTLELIHYTCWLAMIALFLYLTFKDIIAMWF